MEGYTARDALIVMRMDLTDSLQDLEQDIAELRETLQFTGIAGQLLRDDLGDLRVEEFPAIKRWLETVSNGSDLQRDLEEVISERAELTAALEHLEERLIGRSSS